MINTSCGLTAPRLRFRSGWRLNEFHEDAAGIAQIDGVTAAIGAGGDRDRRADEIDAFRVKLLEKGGQVGGKEGEVVAAGVAGARRDALSGRVEVFQKLHVMAGGDAQQGELDRAAGQADDAAEIIVAHLPGHGDLEAQDIAEKRLRLVQVGNGEAGVMSAEDTGHISPSKIVVNDPRLELNTGLVRMTCKTFEKSDPIRPRGARTA